MDELPPDQGEDEEPSFFLEEITDNDDSTPKFHDRQIAASLQRRLQAMGDTAERELSKANKRQPSPNTRQLSPSGREVWGERPLHHPETPAAPRDPLADAARKLKWSGSQARPQKSRRPSPTNSRCRLPAGGRRVIAGKAVPSQCPSRDQPRNQKPSKWRLPPSNRQLGNSRETSEEAVRPATVPIVRSSRTNASLEGILVESQACSSSSSCAEWEGASTSINSLLPASSGLQARLHPMDVFGEGHSERTGAQVPQASAAASAPCALSNDALSAQALSDPVAVLLMYRRMLFQETNNGLMGGTRFISQPGYSAALGTTMQESAGSFSGQMGPQRGLSRVGCRPLLSRSY